MIVILYINFKLFDKMLPFFLKVQVFSSVFYLSINAVIGQSITPPASADIPTGIESFSMTTATRSIPYPDSILILSIEPILKLTEVVDNALDLIFPSFSGSNLY